MLSKYALAAALTVVVAHDIKTHIEAHKAAKAFEEAYQAFTESHAISRHQIGYLLNMIEENGGQLSEFDLLALNFKSH
jgi:hypothetical protein